ncbi:hypothetical protein HC891_06910 [Candidatus Gracilibacteria bacterium]|nr:hypothetical protein [Candidatus Gracilibacteria bacterium]
MSLRCACLLLLMACSLVAPRSSVVAASSRSHLAQECALEGLNSPVAREQTLPSVPARDGGSGRPAMNTQQAGGDPAFGLLAEQAIGGAVGSVALAADAVLIGEGSALVLVDRAEPLRRSARVDFGDLVRDIAVVGDTAYVVAGSAGLQLVDISSGAAPTLRGQLRLPGLPFAVQVVGERAYVAAAGAGGGLQIVDVAVAARPRLLSTFPHYGSASGLALRDNLAFVSGGLAGGLQIVDVSDPRAPVLRGELVTPGVARAIVLDGDRAYLAAGFCGVQQIDISDPAQPQLLGASATAGDAVGLALSGDTLFVAASEGGLVSFAVGGARPQLQAELALAGLVGDLALADTSLLVAGGSAGLLVLTASPSPLVQFTLPALVPTGPLLALGERIATGRGAAGISLVAPDDPDPLTNAITVLTPTVALATRTDALYVVNENGLSVFDVADPLTVTLRTTVALSGTVRGLSVSGERIYIAADSAGVLVLDAGDALSPTLSASWPVSITARAVAISGTLALVAERSQISLRATDDGAVLGRVALPAGALVQDVVLRGSYAYLATSDGLLAIDISDVAMPLVVFRRSGFAAYKLAHSAGQLYVAAGNAGVQVYSLRDAAAPTIRGVRRSSGPALSLVVLEGRVYVAAENAGLARYRLQALPLQLWLPLVQ